MLSRKVQLSGVNTFKLSTLTPAEMKELFAKMQKGDAQARDTLVEGNLRLVLSILQRFKNRGEILDDLFQVGCIGLLKAIDNFRLDQGVNFSTYAVPMIIGEIKRYLRDNNSIHISRSIKNLSHKVQQTREELIKKYSREPKVSEIARELDLSAEEVVFAFNAAQEPVSLYDPVYNDSTDPVYVMDMISDQNSNSDDWLDTLALQEALARLQPREREILEARFFEGKTQMEIARKVGISQAQVSRIEKAALALIRSYYRQEGGGEQDHEPESGD
ncbi:MAG TPA: RNA polymerase sporulation sigma factor SigG [Bacillota bacterium]|jgi:RNA polymerase sporulation-specific sigma factor|nr:RNA polymerase sporulation sigma factor SigG [Bacillota bacterium]HOB86502.1 RNA polymerase sporulation sigma factor SigG [Bacillota bacterium]HOP68212.1 RNA polymerase sporulation sigma factor SigG [Bacillota bacterium]HPT33082.1 RNA polymerase sporulation sigma factor SigG [Bacillota bacterium]HPZ64108.1 RNA polymerase sporulation sigma factor SigG [Bacillota bacterium]